LVLEETQHFGKKMPTASSALRPEVAASQGRRSSLTKSPSPTKPIVTDTDTSNRRSSVTDSISPRRGSLTSPRKGSLSPRKVLSEADGNVTPKRPNYLRRNSSSQQISRDDMEADQDNRTDLNKNNPPSKLNVKRISRRKSSTSGELLFKTSGPISPRNDENSSSSSSRRSSISSSLPNSPRKLSIPSPQQQKSVSPRWVNAVAMIKRRRSSTSSHILSPAERLGTAFNYPEERSKKFTYTSNEFLEGSLLMSEHSSIRALEFLNIKGACEKDGINAELSKMEDEKNHLVLLEAAVKEWLDFLKEIQRLSKGVPLMRSIRLACLQMYKAFVENGGTYGASLLALRRSNLPNVARISKVMEELRAKVEEGGQELSLVDGKFLEEVRELLGILQGTLGVTLAHYR